MKNNFILIVALCTMTTMTAAEAAVGDTQEEAVARYGPPIYQEEKDGKIRCEFIREDTWIATEAQNGQVVLTVYAKRNPSWEANPQEIGLTQMEVEAILQLHGGLPTEWKEVPTEVGKKRIFSEKGLVSLENPEKGRLLLATQSRFQEWETSQNKENALPEGE